jgi:hypothetical protein
MLALTLGLVVQGTPINVESPGIRVVNLVPKLAAESRLALSVVPSLENDVVSIRTMGRPWGEVKANLAKVLNATWEEKDGRFILAQSSEQQRADLVTRYECMRAKIQKLKDELEPYYSANEWSDRELAIWLARATKKFDPETKGASRLPEIVWRRRSDPSGRFMARFFRSTAPEMFLQHGPSWEQVVYSDLTLPLHQKLNIDARSVIEKFKTESEMFKTTPGRPLGSFRPSEETKLSEHWELRFIEEFDGKLSVAMWFYDSNGVYTDDATDFGDYNDASQYEGLSGKSELTKFAEERFSETTNLLSDFDEPPSSADRKAHGSALKLVHELCEALKNAETRDPLAYLGGDDWRLFSKERQSPMISLLADASENRVVMPTHPKLTTGAYRADSSGWILGMQRDPYYVRKHRVDRRQLSKLMAELAVYPGYPSDPINEIDKEVSLKFSRWKHHLEWMPAVDQLVQSMLGYTPMGDLGAVYSALDAGTRSRLHADQSIAISQQPEEARRAYREMLYLAPAMYGLDDRLPAVAFPKVDDGMVFWCTFVKEEGFFLKFPKNEDNTVAPHLNFVDFDGLAQFFADTSTDKQTQVAFASRTSLTLFLQFQRANSSSPKMTSIFNASPKTKSEFIRLDQLSKDFVSKLKERAERLKDDGR